MRTLKLIVEYDGTDLSGWQRQQNGPSVQQHLEDALVQMVHHPVKVIGASRTDAGVHAVGQVAHFHSPVTIPTHGFRRGLNGLLPPSIAIVDCADVHHAFHARFDSRGKHYRYVLLNRRERSPLLRHRAWHRPAPLDLAAMQRAAEHLIGEHDFAAMRATGCQAQTTVRTLHSIEITRPDPHLVHIDVRGNAFLRNMVRILAGTLVAVGEGRLTDRDIPDILARGDRGHPGQTAPARGLTLMEVFYPPPPG